MSDDLEPDELEGELEAVRNATRALAAFTAQCELNGYSRVEALELTREYLRGLIMKGGT